ncbi:hypothetical protein LR48_Vigan11g045600 [Vigna angularis]|uniref:Uncharacterized protein n=1 Tax=Phaseolus angularis TaxID=3914 RepID=A0A0L9VR42_PHAAN|nr:hypothetical protein LR48_Vigan11g045600 [Vigna angularis]
MESEKTSKSAKGEAATTAQRQFIAERHSGSHAGSAEGGMSINIGQVIDGQIYEHQNVMSQTCFTIGKYDRIVSSNKLVIANEIHVCGNTMNNKALLGHPSLITQLCELAGVNISTPPFERPRKAVDEATQPVPPRHPRRGRGLPQGQAPVEPHEAEPFQIRDMYMSLIDHRMQSIHRGQVATAKMIIGMYDTPPGHRWTMDEFNNVVAWPEDQA